MTGYWWTAWLWWIGGAVVGLLGLWLLYCSLLRDRSKGRRRCPKCWYDMSVAESLRCPECGNDAKRAADLLQTRRRWKGLWFCLLVFLTAGLLSIQPKVQQDGWVSVMPKTALILCLRLGNTQALFAELDRRTQINVSEFNTYFPGMLVTDPESLYQWQWRLVGNACVELKKGDTDILDRQLLLEWLHRASTHVTGEDADRFFRATLSFLGDADPGIRRTAAIYCADARSPEIALESIRQLLDDPIKQVRIGAISGLWVLGHYSSAPVPLLVEALKDDDGEVRGHAAASLGSIAEYGEEPTEVFETLVDIYRSDSDVRVQAQALSALCMFESQRARAYEFMREAFRSTESALREEAISSLTMMDQFDEAFDLQFALKGLNDESPDVRFYAAWLLERRVSTESLRPYQELLRGFAESDDENVRRAVRHQLRPIQDPIED